MGIIVQKFGGTSVATPESRELVVQKILAAKQKGYSVVVVVSAIGRKGEPYSTDTLIDLGKSVCEELPHREMDLLLSCGEIISGVIISGLLKQRGLNATCLNGAQAGIITDGAFGRAHIVKVKPDSVLNLLVKDNVVVVAGFQGATENGEITTLGRGGSDTTAAALGTALKAEVIEIYTDVNGIMTADPRIVKNTRTMDRVTYNEICQLAYEGARVIHPRAVEIAMHGNIPLRIKSTFSDEPGTLVCSQVEPYEETLISGDRLITGIAQITNITQFRIDISQVKEKDYNPRLFSKLAEDGISIDFINVSPEQTIFTVPDMIANRVKEIVRMFDIKATVRQQCAKVAVVGAAMTGVPGVMARIVAALSNEGIEILQSADSYTTIWCLVDNQDMCGAVRALHEEFGLGK